MTSILEARGLVKSYGERKAVDGISVDVRGGEVVGLLGPNGAGKTTTFSIILGLIAGDAGRILLDGRDITSLPMFLRAQLGVCLLPQEPSVFRRLSVEDNLLAVLEMRPGSTNDDGASAAQILSEFGLERLAKAKAYTLSGGERRRLEIARALVTRPRFMLLDEPFTGIDPLAVQELQRIIRSLKSSGLGILITDHSVRETLRITDRAYIIHGGTILKSGRPEDLILSGEVRKRYLGEHFTLG
ncbi:MAG: LPS export ABC transporter ATP-binding protein [Candidatus Aminicenantes bacterium]|nr:LPS export ABC transporter ATP-binding protein [Candidatus Aminicenantes bacterium]